jgi:cholesterol oxidase
MPTHDFDYIIIGSGFGGSVSALRLSEKGYRVLVLEQGDWFKASDFPKSNWNLRRWLYLPSLGFRGFFTLRFFRHVAVLGGAGVGGGSLVYANTLAIPESPFFKTGPWASLADWEEELKPFYNTGLKMLGALPNPHISLSDISMQKLSDSLGDSSRFSPTDVAIHFGKPDQQVPDPYFGGEGPERSGCNFCGGCMTGCRYNAKNTLDKNYLHLAALRGCDIRSLSRVVDVKPFGADGSGGYAVTYRDLRKTGKPAVTLSAGAVIFAGGVTGTLSLMLRLKRSSLPRLSESLGYGVRTNSESLIGVTTFRRDQNYSEGIAIGSIVKIDGLRSVEPVRYAEGSGVWRLLMTPLTQGGPLHHRLREMLLELAGRPLQYLRTFFVDDWSKRTQILLYMESIDSTLRMRLSPGGRLGTTLDKGPAPSAFNPKAREIAREVEKINDGKAMVLASESILGIPTTAHILGGACMGRDAAEGVIDSLNRVHNYSNLYVCDGSAISANIGVNPSLTILAITERAMAQIPPKSFQ